MKYNKDIIKSGNDFFQLAYQGRRKTHWALILPVFIIIVLLSVYITAISADLFFGVSEEINYYKETYITTGMFGFLVFFLFLWVRYFEKRKFYTLGFTKESALKKYLKGFGLGILLTSLIVFLMVVFGGAKINMNPNNAHFSKVTILVAMIVFILQGASEEILFRGWLMQILGARFKPIIGIVLSLVLFTLFHGANSGFNLLVAVNLILFTILLTLLILQGKSLWAASGFHSSWNWTICNIFGFTISGSETEEFGASVLSLKGVGSSFLSGGDFGPEGSIFTTIISVLAIALMLFQDNREKIWSWKLK